MTSYTISWWRQCWLNITSGFVFDDVILFRRSNLSANQISSTYLNSWLRYHYFRYGKTNVRHIGILLPVATWPHHSNRRVILHQITKFCPPAAEYDVIYNFKMAVAAAPYYFRLRIWRCHFLPKVNIYQQTKFHRPILIHSWDITTSGLEKQPFAILELYFRFRFRPCHRSRYVILHQSAKFHPNRNAQGRKMTSCRFWILEVQ